MPYSFLARRGKSRGSSFLPKKARCSDHWASEIVNQGFLSSASARPSPRPAARPAEPARNERRSMGCRMGCSGVWLLGEDGVENADGLPGVLVLRDELLVPRVVLVLVVGGLV